MDTTTAIGEQEAPHAAAPELPAYLLRYAVELERWRQESLAARGADKA